MKKDQLKERSYKFSLNIIDLLDELPKNYIYQTVGKQLLRSATSIGANIIEAQAGRTKRDFINYYQIALKSTNETKYWLEILVEKINADDLAKNLQRLLQEVTEIGSMLAASLITMKGKRNYY